MENTKKIITERKIKGGGREKKKKREKKCTRTLSMILSQEARVEALIYQESKIHVRQKVFNLILFLD